MRKLPRISPKPLRHNAHGWKIHFSYNGKQYKKFIGNNEQIAYVLQSEVNNLFAKFKCGLIAPESHLSLEDFIFSQVFKKPDSKEVKSYQSIKYLSQLINKYKLYLDSFLPEEKPPKSIETEKIHLRHLERFITYEQGSNNKDSYSALEHIGTDPILKNVDVDYFDDYKAYRIKQCVLNNTINKEIYTFSSMWKLALQKKYVEENVLQKIKMGKIKINYRYRTHTEVLKLLQNPNLPSAKKKNFQRYRYFNSEEIGNLIRIAKLKIGEEHWLIPILITFAFSGMRQSELLELELSDVDLEKARLFIYSRKQSRKIQKKERVINIPYKLLSVLKKQLNNHKEDWVFPGPNGGKLSKHSLRSALQQATKNSEFEGIGFHCFRHSLVSSLASKGISISTIADILGHKAYEMVERYRHIFPPDTENAMKQIDIPL